jgi:hypothetical protein
VDGGERYDDQIEKRITNLERKVEDLVAWRNWVLGSVAGIGLMFGAFAKNILDIFRGHT